MSQDPSVLLPFSQALVEARAGRSFGLCGLSDVPAEVIQRAMSLYRRFGRNPSTYLFDWDRFQKEKQRAQIK